MKSLAHSRSGPLPFKGRVGEGMGHLAYSVCPIPLPTSPLKGEGPRGFAKGVAR